MGVVSSRVQPVGSRWAADGSRQTCRRRFGTSNPLLSPAAGTVVLRCTALAPVVAVGEEHLLHYNYSKRISATSGTSGTASNPPTTTSSLLML